jgi:signal transduction histidine kinase
MEDHGIGFDQDDAQQVFGLFKRLCEKDVPGTGLGLAICRRIVERQGGRRGAESRRGEGFPFFLGL